MSQSDLSFVSFSGGLFVVAKKDVISSIDRVLIFTVIVFRVERLLILNQLFFLGLVFYFGFESSGNLQLELPGLLLLL